ncbi:MAG: metallophosphoesterase [Clostridia bacterium]|nr:metallophosphoesterase [Clostridia bacterium]
MLNIRYTALSVGAKRPFTLLHAGDTHLTRADARDGERKVTLAEKRARVFPNAEAYLRELGELQSRENCPIVHSGDLIDFVSQPNLEAAKAFTDAHDCFMAAGNHEFSLYVGEAFEDAAYRNQSLEKVQAAFKNDIRMASRTLNGVKLVALDNGYYRFEEEQLTFLQRECAEGLPVILVMHTPLYTPALHDYMLHVRAAECGYLCGTPKEEMASYSQHRYIQQMPDEVTLETCRYIADCPQIRCLLTGHIHVDVYCPLVNGKPQYAVGLDSVGRITVR